MIVDRDIGNAALVQARDEVGADEAGAAGNQDHAECPLVSLTFAAGKARAQRRDLDTLNTGCYPKTPGKLMNSSDTDYAKQHLSASRDAFAKAAEDAGFLTSIEKITDALAGSLQAGGKVLLCGNGGSAADAQHIAAELVARYEMERAAMAAIALTTDTSALTAIGNDYGFDHVYERQVLALGKKGDVLIAISTSGKSPNILKALEAAKKLGLVTVGFSGAKDGPMAKECD